MSSSGKGMCSVGGFLGCTGLWFIDKFNSMTSLLNRLCSNRCPGTNSAAPGSAGHLLWWRCGYSMLQHIKDYSLRRFPGKQWTGTHDHDDDDGDDGDEGDDGDDGDGDGVVTFAFVAVAFVSCLSPLPLFLVSLSKSPCYMKTCHTILNFNENNFDLFFQALGALEHLTFEQPPPRQIPQQPAAPSFRPRCCICVWGIGIGSASSSPFLPRLSLQQKPLSCGKWMWDNSLMRMMYYPVLNDHNLS